MADANMRLAAVVLVLFAGVCGFSAAQRQQQQREEVPFLLFATSHTINRIEPWPATSVNLRRLIMEFDGGIQGLDYHYRRGLVFWTNSISGSIKQARFSDGQGTTPIVTDLQFPSDVAVDWLNDKLYWVDRNMKTIEEYDLETKDRRVVIRTGGSESTPIGLTLFVYPEYGWLYWTDRGSETIERVPVNGNGKETILQDLGCVWPIALEYISHTLYWADSCSFTLKSKQLLTRQDSDPPPLSLSGVSFSRGITHFEDVLYWSEVSRAFAVNKTIGENSILVYRSTSTLPMRGLEMISSQKQPEAEEYVQQIASTTDHEACQSCVHGFCIGPGLCVCHEGWVGVNCSAAPVTGVVANLYNSTAFIVSWNELKVVGFNVTSYVLYYKAYSPFLNRTITEFSMSVMGSVLEVYSVVDSLDPELEHQFQVSAVLSAEGMEPFEADRSQPTKVIIDQAPFQIKYGPTEHCITWTKERAQAIEKDIYEAIAKVLSNRLRHDFPREFLRPGLFSCQHAKNDTTYRSTVIGTTTHTAADLVAMIQEWVQSGPAIQMEWYVAKLYSCCPVKIASIVLEAECVCSDGYFCDKQHVINDCRSLYDMCRADNC